MVKFNAVNKDRCQLCALTQSLACTFVPCISCCVNGCEQWRFVTQDDIVT